MGIPNRLGPSDFRRTFDHAEKLSDITLVVIGLWNMGYTDLETVAHLLWIVDLKPLRRLFKMLKTSKDPFIRRFVDVGLPPGVCRELPNAPGPVNDLCLTEIRKVRCKLCGYWLDCVPCPRCSLRNPPEKEFPFRNRPPILRYSQDPVQPEHSTRARPGSIQKIDVLRERLCRGESLFHGRDRKLPSNGHLS